MKKTFTLEIDCPPDCESLTLEAVKESIRGILWGEYGRRKALTIEIVVKEIPVEQSMEPLKNQEKTLDLLKRAAKVINDYERDDRIDPLVELSEEIEEYIEENTRGKIIGERKN